MVDHETMPGGLNALFWEERPSDKGQGNDHRFWYNEMAGMVRDAPPPVVTGGFLCEEMGLGKTIEMAALILSNPYSRGAAAAGRAKVMPRGTPGRPAQPPLEAKATLVVVPLSLLSQWQDELIKATGKEGEGGLRVALWYGERREHLLAKKTCTHRDRSKSAYGKQCMRTATWGPADEAAETHCEQCAHVVNAEAMADEDDDDEVGMAPPLVKKFTDDNDGKARMAASSLLGVDGGHPAGNVDVVLTTYEMLLQETRGKPETHILSRVHWWRVVLDESQNAPKPQQVGGHKSALGAMNNALAGLSRCHSWLMSGTPVNNVVDDLLGQLMFLGVEPYSTRGAEGDAFWEREVSSRWRLRDADALEVVLDLLGCVMMRHSKVQKAGGEAIVKLPPRAEEVVKVRLQDPSERVVYGELERFARQQLLRGGGGAAAGQTREPSSPPPTRRASTSSSSPSACAPRASRASSSSASPNLRRRRTACCVPSTSRGSSRRARMGCRRAGSLTTHSCTSSWRRRPSRGSK